MEQNDASELPNQSPSSPSRNGVNGEPADRRRIIDLVLSQERHAVGRTEDEELLNRLVPTIPRAEAPELAAFTHTDPWRVLRIQGEFVHGINALAGVGAAVAVFGSARIRADHPDYAAARDL